MNFWTRCLRRYVVSVNIERKDTMKKIKKISTLIMLCLLMIAMTACGGGSKPAEEPVEEPGTEQGTEVETEMETETESTSPNENETEISADFKATMDSYEEFFDEYVDFMKKYKENPTDTTLLTESADMLTKEAEMMREMESMDQSEMTTAEAAYYLEVTSRIYAKLANVI